MTNDEKLKKDVHDLVMAYVQTYFGEKRGKNSPEKLSVHLIGTSVANKQNEESTLAVLLQNEAGDTAAVRAKEPRQPYEYQIIPMDNAWFAPDWQPVDGQEQPEFLIDMVLAIAYDYLQNQTILPEKEALSFRFVDRAEAVRYCLKKLENTQAVNELMLQAKELLHSLQEQF